MKTTVRIIRRALVWHREEEGGYRWDPYTGSHAGPSIPAGYRITEQEFTTLEEAKRPFSNEKPGSASVTRITTEVFEGKES